VNPIPSTDAFPKRYARFSKLPWANPNTEHPLYHRGSNGVAPRKSGHRKLRKFHSWRTQTGQCVSSLYSLRLNLGDLISTGWETAWRLQDRSASSRGPAVSLGATELLAVPPVATWTSNGVCEVGVIERGSGGFAKDTLKDLKSLLANQTQHSAFRSANALLPRPSTKSYEWKSELAYSRGYIEKYFCELRADLEAETGKSTFQPNDS
jgi:hypothetical protein